MNIVVLYRGGNILPPQFTIDFEYALRYAHIEIWCSVYALNFRMLTHCCEYVDNTLSSCIAYLSSVAELDIKCRGGQSDNMFCLL
jgi:hypothetical protein